MPPIIISAAVFYGLSGFLAAAGLLALALRPGPPAECKEEEVRNGSEREKERGRTREGDGRGRGRGTNTDTDGQTEREEGGREWQSGGAKERG